MDEETRVYSPRFNQSESSLRNTAIWLMQKVGGVMPGTYVADGSQTLPTRKTKLHERLQDMIILELRADG